VNKSSPFAEHRSAIRLRAAEAWVAAAAAALGLASAYWDDSWHTTLGRDSALIPPHLLLYMSITAVGAVLGIWALRQLRVARSVRVLLRTPGFSLAAAAAAATVLAAPADAFWHATFGRDAVLWSPPHLLSVVSTLVLLIALNIGLAPNAPQSVRVALAIPLLGASQIVVMEYDTDVPQFPEQLYLPLLLLTTLGTAWVIQKLNPQRGILTIVVAGYILFRVALVASLGIAEWIAPDFPLALLGLVALDARIGVWRWPLAASLIGALEIAAAAARISSVQLLPVVQSAALSFGFLAAATIAILLVSRKRGLAAASLTLAIGLLAISAPSPAEAHDPGQGPQFGSALVSTVGGRDPIVVSVSDFEGLDVRSLDPSRLVARRAGETVLGTLQRIDGGFVGSIVLPSDGLWFVYAQFSGPSDRLEVWVAVDRRDDNSNAIRAIYEPVGERSATAGQLAAGGIMFSLAALLLIGSVVAVKRSVRMRRSADADGET
jgi:hypothetical protein